MSTDYREGGDGVRVGIPPGYDWKQRGDGRVELCTFINTLI